jgi:hypothetical protein
MSPIPTIKKPAKNSIQCLWEVKEFHIELEGQSSFNYIHINRLHSNKYDFNECSIANKAAMHTIPIFPSGTVKITKTTSVLQE